MKSSCGGVSIRGIISASYARATRATEEEQRSRRDERRRDGREGGEGTDAGPGSERAREYGKDDEEIERREPEGPQPELHQAPSVRDPLRDVGEVLPGEGEAPPGHLEVRRPGRSAATLRPQEAEVRGRPPAREEGPRPRDAHDETLLPELLE